MSTVVVIAPHPDDETLGCGGSLLKHIKSGDAVHWVILTSMTKELGFSSERIAARAEEIKLVAKTYGFAGVHELGFPTTRLDTVSRATLIEKISAVFQNVKPEVVYVPHKGDVHTDHHVAFDAAVSCTKWFRYGSIKKILSYETLSETDFGLDPKAAAFVANVFVPIEAELDTKIKIMGMFQGEMGASPFPRSAEVMRAQALLRGAQCGKSAAEAFVLLKEIY